MRCLTLALALQEVGHTVLFAMQELPGSAFELVRDTGAEVMPITGNPVSLDGLLTDDDRIQTENIANKTRAACVLIDHYGAAATYFAGIKARFTKIAVIDDMADRNLAAVDWLLNQNLGASRLPYRIREDCIRLLGPTYALLRPEFVLKRRGPIRYPSKSDRRILVTLGGGDTAELSVRVLQALDRCPLSLKIRCILGDCGSISSGIAGAVSASCQRIEILHGTSDMAGHMAWADISVNAGGSTCWELCCLGTPMIVLATSEDQELIGAELARAGCAEYLGEWRPERAAFKLVQKVRELLQAPERRIKMSTRGRQLVDGLGAERAAESLMSFAASGSAKRI